MSMVFHYIFFFFVFFLFAFCFLFLFFFLFFLSFLLFVFIFFFTCFVFFILSFSHSSYSSSYNSSTSSSNSSSLLLPISLRTLLSPSPLLLFPRILPLHTTRRRINTTAQHHGSRLQRLVDKEYIMATVKTSPSSETH